MQSTTNIPFRWDVSRRELLGSIPEVNAAESYPEFLSDLRRCAARVVYVAGDADLLFVGRSPESLFDYLSGIVHETRWPATVRMLNVSIGEEWPSRATRALRGYLRAVGLEPTALLHRDRPVALVDLVWTGGTLAKLVGVMREWCRESRVDGQGVARKLAVVGIPEKGWSGNWRENHVALRWLPMSAKRCVSIPKRLWCYLGEDQIKVVDSHPPDRWGDPCVARPPAQCDPARRAALRLALEVHRRARTRTEREAFVAELSRGFIRARHVRSLIAHLRGLSGSPGKSRGGRIGLRNSFALIPPCRFVTVATIRFARANMTFGRDVLLSGVCPAGTRPGTWRFHPCDFNPYSDRLIRNSTSPPFPTLKYSASPRTRASSAAATCSSHGRGRRRMGPGTSRTRTPAARSRS
jgi:hypothetical protein